jgi:uncharacterized integral membrane protein (TIGR00698 family)
LKSLDENLHSDRFSLGKILTHSKNLPGLLLVATIGIIAHFLGKAFPLLGGAVIAILLGILIRQCFGVPQLYSNGISFTLKKLLKFAIILLGFGFSFSQIAQVGLHAIVIVLVAVSAGIFLTYYLAKLFKLDGNIPLLISLGTGICGATAIATSGPIIKAKEEEIVYAVNTIFAFNVLAVLLYPLVGQALLLPDQQFGVWVGAAIHDTSSVVAAGYNFSNAAGDTSVVVKLMRTMMLVPVAIILSAYMTVKNRNSLTEQDKLKWANAFPFFILIFAGAAAINTFFELPLIFVDGATTLAKFMILMVMASVGLGTDLKKIKSVGFRPLLVGLISSFIMGSICLILVKWLV